MDVDVKQEMFAKLMTWLQNTETFVQEQSPLLAQELLSFGFWWSLIEAIIFSICIVGAILWTRKFYFQEWGIDYRKKLRTKDFSEVVYILTWSYNVICLVFAIGILANIYIIIKITLAPRVYLLDKLMSILS